MRYTENYNLVVAELDDVANIETSVSSNFPIIDEELAKKADKSNMISKGSSTTPVYFDANGIAQTTKNFDDYELKTNVTSKGSSTTPVYFDANGIAQTTKNFNDYALKSNVTSKGSETTPIYFDANGIARTTKNFDDYLPLNGGTMKGAITHNNVTALKRDVDNSDLEIYGATAYNKGAYLLLYGKDNANNSGQAVLCGSDGSQISRLRVYANGDLTMGDKTVLVEKASSKTTRNSGYVLFSNNIIVAWAMVTGTYSGTARTVTKPYANGFTTLVACSYDTGESGSGVQSQMWIPASTTKTTDDFKATNTVDTFGVLWIGVV